MIKKPIGKFLRLKKQINENIERCSVAICHYDKHYRSIDEDDISDASLQMAYVQGQERILKEIRDILIGKSIEMDSIAATGLLSFLPPIEEEEE